MIIESHEVLKNNTEKSYRIYIENPQDATRRLLELINEFGKVAG